MTEVMCEECSEISEISEIDDAGWQFFPAEDIEDPFGSRNTARIPDLYFCPEHRRDG